MFRGVPERSTRFFDFNSRTPLRFDAASTPEKRRFCCPSAGSARAALRNYSMR